MSRVVVSTQVQVGEGSEWSQRSEGNSLSESKLLECQAAGAGSMDTGGRLVSAVQDCVESSPVFLLTPGSPILAQRG